MPAATPKRRRIRDPLRRQLDRAQNQSGGGYFSPGHHDDEPAAANNDNDNDNNNGSSASVLITPAGRHAQNGRPFTLAGQLATPPCGLPGESDLLGESAHSDGDYRKALGSKRRRDQVDADEQASGAAPLFSLPSHHDDRTAGWSTLAFSTLGGVVGKVWAVVWPLDRFDRLERQRTFEREFPAPD